MSTSKPSNDQTQIPFRTKANYSNKFNYVTMKMVKSVYCVVVALNKKYYDECTGSTGANCEHYNAIFTAICIANIVHAVKICIKNQRQCNEALHTKEKNSAHCRGTLIETGRRIA